MSSTEVGNPGGGIYPSNDLVRYRNVLSGSLTSDPSSFYGLSTRSIRYDSYAGTDIVAEIVLPNEGPMTIGELQTISYSLHRENSPVRVVGHTNVLGFVHGPRTIAGSMIFTSFNTYAFYRLSKLRNVVEMPGNTLFPTADMLPPFDIVLTFANESGSFSKMRIFGVTIVDEGGTMSVDDLITENTFTWMARGIQPMIRFVPDVSPEDLNNVGNFPQSLTFG